MKFVKKRAFRKPLSATKFDRALTCDMIAMVTMNKIYLWGTEMEIGMEAVKTTDRDRILVVDWSIEIHEGNYL
jgi:hypothetical protein